MPPFASLYTMLHCLFSRSSISLTLRLIRSEVNSEVIKEDNVRLSERLIPKDCGQEQMGKR